MLSFTTRNRPHVLEYSLRRTREVYDGYLLVIDDNSECKLINAEISRKYDAEYLFNETRLGIPRSKARGFEHMINFNRQFWFDDDCFPLKGWYERVVDAQKYQGHLLHLKPWAHIRVKKYVRSNIIQYTAATACFMSFRKDQYDKVRGFDEGFQKYGHWHSHLSNQMGGFFAVKNSPFHSFDVDGTPKDFNGPFESSMPLQERRDELKSYIRKTGKNYSQSMP